MSKRKITVKEMGSRAEAITALKDLIIALEAGNVSIADGKDEISVGVPEDVKVTLKGKFKGAKVKLTMGLSWKQDGDVPAAIPEGAPPAKKQKAKTPVKKPAAKTPAKKEKAKTPAKKAAPKKAAEKKPAAKKEATKADKK